MRLTQKVSFQGSQAFEQYTAEFTLEDTDMNPELFGACNLLEKMFLFNTVVSLEGLLFQFAKGYIGVEDYKAQKSRLVGLLSPKLEGVLKELLTNGRNRASKP